MVGIDVGHHSHDRQEVQKRSVRFIGFHHNVIACAQLGIGAGAVQAAANDKGGVQSTFGQDTGHQTRGGGFAVCARNGHPLLHAHEFGQHHSARHHRNVTCARHQHFGIVGFDGSGRDHRIGIFHILGTVTHKRLNAQAGQAAQRGAVGQIRT